VYAAEGKFAICRSNANTIATYSMNFKLTDVPNYAEYTALFDQFRIKTVVIKWSPKQTTGVLMAYDSTNPVGQTIIPNVWGAPDYDDDAAVNVEALKQYSHAKWWPITKPHTEVVHPRVTTDVFQGVTTAYAAANKPVWIDCAYPDTVFYGFKTAIELDSTTPVMDEADVPHFFTQREVLYYLEFKNTR
jgi:hypothetical protein